MNDNEWQVVCASMLCVFLSLVLASITAYIYKYIVLKNRGKCKKTREHIEDGGVRIEHQDSLSLQSCIICKKVFSNGSIYCILECENTIHASCMREWFKNHAMCPKCKPPPKQM